MSHVRVLPPDTSKRAGNEGIGSLVHSRPSAPLPPSRPSLLPSAVKGVRWPVVWFYLAVLAYSFVLGRVSGMNLGGTVLFMFIGGCGAAGWIRSRK